MSALRVCILTSQYFGWGIYGGFGSMSRTLAERLAREGHQISVIVPRRSGQEAHALINGVHVFSFSPFRPSQAARLIADSPADVFHSQDPTVLTWLAERAHPRRVHLVTCRDPRDARDWWTEFRWATPTRRLLIPFNYLTESSTLVAHSVRRATAVFCPAYCLRTKIQRVFGLSRLPQFIPNLIDVPPTMPTKSAVPTMTFVGRWDGRKRPEVFMELARHFPRYRFIGVGQGSRSAEARYDVALRQRYASVPNLQMPGFIDRFADPARLNAILSETWILVNPASREGLPLTFLEAAAHGCRILSAEDPDGFASRFGRRVEDGDYASALAALLDEDPREKSQAAFQYVRETYEASQALAAHVSVYRSLLS
ncbi:MAG: glycosyltransferase family 4 protein [Acidobacteriota bacterium]